jgi:hypothetical protein
VIPEILDRLISDPDKEKAGRVMAALRMKKLNIAALQRLMTESSRLLHRGNFSKIVWFLIIADQKQTPNNRKKIRA